MFYIHQTDKVSFKFYSCFLITLITVAQIKKYINTLHALGICLKHEYKNRAFNRF